MTEAYPHILVLFAHPALEKSRVGARLAEAVRDLPGVTFHDLYEARSSHVSVNGTAPAPRGRGQGGEGRL